MLTVCVNRHRERLPIKLSDHEFTGDIAKPRYR